MRAVTFGENPHGMLSRGVGGIAGRTLIVNLPGSVNGADGVARGVAPALRHGVELLLGRETDHNACTTRSDSKSLVATARLPTLHGDGVRDHQMQIFAFILIAGIWAAFLLPSFFESRRKAPMTRTRNFARSTLCWRPSPAPMPGAT